MELSEKVKRTNQAQAVVCIAILMLAAVGMAVMVDEESTIEVDAIDPITIGIILILLTSAMLATLAYVLLTMQDNHGNDEWTRNMETQSVAQSIGIGLAYYRNALDNYINIWKLTDEHFIRNAEISAASLYQKDKAYNSVEVLEEAGVYLNAAYMLANSGSQVSEHFHNLNERLSTWNNTPTYQNKMTLDWHYGSQFFGSKSNFDGWLKTSVSPIEGKDRAYISGGDFWSFGGSATLTALNGTTVTVPEGKTDLDALGSFSPGIYKLPTGRQFAGDMVYIIDPNAAPISSAIVMMADTNYKLATLNNNGKVIVDGSQYDNLSIRISPEGGTPIDTNVTSGLTRYTELQTAVNRTIVNVNNSASTVWNIYTAAGAVSYYLTTLMVPNVYQDINITQAQQELITKIALVQLADFTMANKEKIEAGDYQLSTDSMTLFVRGDLKDRQGNILHENVIFTPFYYGQDVDLHVGSNIQTQTAIVPIWSMTGSTLSSWSFTSSTREATMTTLNTGYEMYVYEILYDGQFVSDVHLDVKNIDIIDPQELPIDPIDPPPPGGIDWVTILCIFLGIIGAVAAVSYVVHHKWKIVAGGVALIVVAVVVYILMNSVIGKIGGFLF